MPPRRALLPFVLALLVALPGTLRAEDPAAVPSDLTALVAAYRSIAGRRDETGYATQRLLTERLADLRRPDAQEALEQLLVEFGGADRRRASILLGACLRRGTPDDLDQALRYVEAARDTRLLGLLSTAAAGILEPQTRKHLRESALPRALPPLKAELARAIGAMGEPEGLVPLIALLGEPHLIVRIEALGALGLLKDARAQGPMLAMLADEDARLREAAARALGMLGQVQLVPRLVPLLDDAAPLVVESAATALSLLGSPEAIGPLIERLAQAETTDLRVADTLARSLEHLTGRLMGTDAAQWRAWWATARLEPFVRPETPVAGKTVEPLRYHGFPVRSSKLVFVLDISRSMGWNGRLDRAKRELCDVLQNLPRSTRFNLVMFSDRAYRWEGGLVPATLTNVRRAISYVQRQEPQSGTGTHAALEAAFAEPDMDTIFFLSDGHPSVGSVSDPELILSDLNAWNRTRRVRVHTIALLIGDPPPAFAGMEDADRAAEFMRRVAEEHDGQFKAIR